MEVPKSSINKSSKIVDIAYQQEHQFERNNSRFTSELNHRPSKTELLSDELTQQLTEQEAERERLKAATKTLLGDKSDQIAGLRHEISGLNSELKIRAAKISILEQEHQAAHDKIHQLMMDNLAAKEQLGNEDIQHELDEQKITNGVLRHHCIRLADNNDELEQSLRVCRNELSQALATIEKLHPQLAEVQNSHTKQVSIIAEQNVVIARQESDLKHALSSYYDGVINHDQEPNLTVNLPKAR